MLKFLRKLFVAIFTLHFFDYRSETKIYRFNGYDDIYDHKRKIIVRKSTIDGHEEYKIGGGYMFNNPWNNPWRYYDDSMKKEIIEFEMI